VAQRFWKHILSPAATALATGSSVATIPVNLEAAKKVGVPKEIRETVIPIGATIHMDGSCLSAILKIAFLFGIFEQDFSGIGTFLTAYGERMQGEKCRCSLPIDASKLQPH
jgi:Na+/H+-dicarboxylate symporter